MRYKFLIMILLVLSLTTLTVYGWLLGEFDHWVLWTLAGIDLVAGALLGIVMAVLAAAESSTYNGGIKGVCKALWDLVLGR